MTLLASILVVVVVLIPNSPWRNEGGGFLPQSPLLSSVVFIVFFIFMVMGVAYGVVLGTIKNMEDVVHMMGESRT